ncbi:unnamed protein product [Lactuca virosa]|uniref:Uncharacterized protein n=1 Tax=Lactuca virosa TaxID=75947 RepID=A0AAU9NJ21_9ASTR|nr:unnamed protein product [Lactuca virosa]
MIFSPPIFFKCNNGRNNSLTITSSEVFRRQPHLPRPSSFYASSSPNPLLLLLPRSRTSCGSHLYKSSISAAFAWWYQVWTSLSPRMRGREGGVEAAGEYWFWI